MPQVTLEHITANAEQVITDCARVSSPANKGKDGAKLIKYLMKHGHWSPLEMASACFQITTSRAIAPQLLRHKSFSFQEASQRYSEAPERYEHLTARYQSKENRQGSIDLAEPLDAEWFIFAQQRIQDECQHFYKLAIKKGVAREQARYLLPLQTETTLYMTGNIRSWYHYCDLRMKEDTQMEHAEIAQAIAFKLHDHLPNVFASIVNE